MQSRDVQSPITRADVDLFVGVDHPLETILHDTNIPEYSYNFLLGVTKFLLAHVLNTRKYD